MQFRYIDHTADAMVEAYGKRLEDAFKNTALGVFNIITDIRKVRPVSKVQIKVKADKVEKLLFDFLDELLFYLDTKHLIFCKFSDFKIVLQDKEYFLTCTAIGDNVSGYERHGDVKAPTYNEMSIKETKDKFIIRAVVDI